MEICLIRPEDSLEQSKGIESPDLNTCLILVQASVEPVAQSFSKLRNMDIWNRDIYDSQVEIWNDSTLIFQLRNHSWVIIYKSLATGHFELTEQDAQVISESLSTSALYFAASDTTGYISYCFYKNGISMEKLFSEELDEGEAIEFQSQLRLIETKDIEEVSSYSFTNEFLREQDVYIPGLIEQENFVVGQNTILRIENLMPSEVERMDYLAQR